MSETLVKSFDNIKFHQEKMDNKAYIFIGFIGFLITFISDKETEIFDNLNISNNLIIVSLISILIPLVISLIPIITNKLVLKRKQVKIKNSKPINIFYYEDLCRLSIKDFLNNYKKFYCTNVSKVDEVLMNEILINAKILANKNTLHFVSQIIIIIWILIYIKLVLCP